MGAHPVMPRTHTVRRNRINFIFILIVNPLNPSSPGLNLQPGFWTGCRLGSMDFGMPRDFWKFAMPQANRMCFRGRWARRCHVIRRIPMVGENAAGDGEQGEVGEEASESFHK